VGVYHSVMLLEDTPRCSLRSIPIELEEEFLVISWLRLSDFSCAIGPGSTI